MKFEKINHNFFLNSENMFEILNLVFFSTFLQIDLYFFIDTLSMIALSEDTILHRSFFPYIGSIQFCGWSIKMIL